MSQYVSEPVDGSEFGGSGFHLNKRIVISGCSGGGKSTLLNELARLGFDVVAEPGRRIVAEESISGGSAFPWDDPEAFARRAVEMSRLDLDRISNTGDWVFFDRGLIDAAAALAHATGNPISDYLDNQRAYHKNVFLAPPWPDIYIQDEERQHGLDQAMVEYSRLLNVYPSLDYTIVLLPKTSVERRAEFILQTLGI